LSGEELLLPKPTYSIITDFFIEYKLSESANDSSNFWRDQLQGSPSLAFPNFHSVINVSPKTQEASRVLDISVSNLNEVSHSLQVSRQTIFQAAYCYMLSTYLGSKDVTFGTVFSGRTLPVKGIETVLGPCIRTLPTRMDLDKMQNVTDLMLAIQNMNRKSLEHGSLPLQDIKKASGIDPQRSLFDTALVWQESIWSEDQSALFHEIGNGEFLEFAFLLDLEPKEDRIHAKMSFQQSILPHEQAQILLEQIDVVASILIENPALPIEDVASHLPSSILSISNAEPETEAEVDIPSLVSEIERIASTDPYRKAVEVLLQGSSDSESMIIESISYAQLHSRSNRLANYLTQAGLQKGDLTALVLEKSIDILVSVLALAKIGAGLLSLAHDTDATPQLTNSILATAKPRFCLVNQSVIDLTLPASTSQVLIPDSLNDFDDCLAFPTNDDGFHIICAENSNPSHSTSSPTNNDLMNTDFNIFSFSSYNLQSHIKALADSYPAVSSGSKLLHTSPLASASEY
jgi:non-ribosomal peptide synthetase component F